MTTKKRITAVWASPHNPTTEQLESLKKEFSKVEFLKEINPELFDEICNSPSDEDELDKLAVRLCDATVNKALIQPAGSPAFQFALGKEIKDRRGGWYEFPVPRPIVVYAHSKRESIDEVLEDGTIKKVSIFKHEGWIYL